MRYGISVTTAMTVLLLISVAGAQETQEQLQVPTRLPGCLEGQNLLTNDEPLTTINLSLNLQQERMPIDCSLGLFEPVGSDPAQRAVDLEFYWAASELYHQPLYFDDTLLERYGQSAHPVLQPVLSGAHFFGQIPLAPYKIGLDRPYDHVYTFGYYRPGSPKPCIGRRLPLEADAGLFTAGTALALIFLLP